MIRGVIRSYTQKVDEDCRSAYHYKNDRNMNWTDGYNDERCPAGNVKLCVDEWTESIGIKWSQDNGVNISVSYNPKNIDGLSIPSEVMMTLWHNEMKMIVIKDPNKTRSFRKRTMMMMIMMIHDTLTDLFKWNQLWLWFSFKTWISSVCRFINMNTDIYRIHHHSDTYMSSDWYLNLKRWRLLIYSGSRSKDRCRMILDSN